MLVEGMTLAASNLQYAPVIGCLGNTGTGKSLILTSILDRQVYEPSYILIIIYKNNNIFFEFIVIFL